MPPHDRANYYSIAKMHESQRGHVPPRETDCDERASYGGD
jgi:hypothetical protein